MDNVPPVNMKSQQTQSHIQMSMDVKTELPYTSEEPPLLEFSQDFYEQGNMGKRTLLIAPWVLFLLRFPSEASQPQTRKDMRSLSN